MSRRLTVLFMPESAYGPTNNCIGIGDVLRRQGHRVVFAAESSWRGKLEALGFEEDLVDLGPPEDDTGQAGQFWTDFIRDTAPLFRLPTIEQIEQFLLPTWRALIDGARYCQSQLEEIVERQHPDVIVEDNVVGFPALVTAGVPFVRIVSCNPLEMKDREIPPPFSGYPANDNVAWAGFRAEYERVLRPLWSEFADWMTSCGASPLADLEFIHESAELNLYLYPEALDYGGRRPLGPTWHRLDSCVRATEEPFSPPPLVEEGAGALVYVSLGSLGSADVDLMRRLIDVLAETPHRFIVSKGPLADQYELADNMWGAAQVPQTTVLPLVDLAITHGGNNTTTECCHFGVPMVVLPLFWDQYDNAQRVEETGFGRRLSTYGFETSELANALDELSADTTLKARMRVVSGDIQLARGTMRAASLIQDAAGSETP